MSATFVRETHAAYRLLRRFIPLGVLRSEKEYRKAVAILDEIIPEATGPEVLRSLMGAHGLTQSDLPEIGSQGVVSEILSGERELNIRQIRRLAKRFGVSPAVFITAP
jgi:Helix-turn-helix